MNHALTAEDLYIEMKRMPQVERVRFFSLLASNAFHEDDFTHEQVFGETHQEPFSALEAAQYLEVSVPTLRRYVQSGKLTPSHLVGRNQIFSAQTLRAFKRSHGSRG
ncbi:MAG TPA: helix-turn-helix domain-containing protein [Rhodocyclaceae bacterium]|nr:helix-turn-helix domain-containing protein [Rhodocyclaceae bacterium]